MRKTKVTIPRANAAFRIYIDVAIVKAKASITAYDLPSTAFDKVTPLYDHYVSMDMLAGNPDTATVGVVRERNTARKALETAWRAFLNEYIRYNLAVPESDFPDFGMRLRDVTRTPVGPPTKKANVSITRVGTFQYDIRVLQEGIGKFARPKNAVGSFLFEAITEIGKTPDLSEYRIINLSSNDRHHAEYASRQIGQQVHIFACYVNAHGKAGPRGPVETFIIG
jgi:hypothetical protein